MSQDDWKEPGNKCPFPRDFLKTDLARDIHLSRFFRYLLLKARWDPEPITREGITIERGQLLRSHRRIIRDLEYVENNQIKRYSTSKISRMKSKLEDQELIDTLEHPLGTLYTVVDYDEMTAMTANSEQLGTGAWNSIGTAKRATLGTPSDALVAREKQGTDPNPEQLGTEKTGGLGTIKRRVKYIKQLCDFDADDRPDPRIKEVWESYCEIFDGIYNPRTFGEKRKRSIRARLRSFSQEEIEKAMIALRQSDWHVGDNPNNKVYAKPEFIFKNDEKVEEWLNNYQEGKSNDESSYEEEVVL